MKKLICILLCILLVTGCGGKEEPSNPENPNNPDNPSTENPPIGATVPLDCNMINDEEGVKAELVATTTYREDKTTIALSKTEIKISVTEDKERIFKQMADDLVGQYDSYKNLTGVNLSIENNEKNLVVVIIEIDYTKLDENAKKVLDVTDANTPYEELKQQYVSAGYTCK